MVLSILKVGESDATRAGFITSRRVGGAVERNRVRRRLREMVRTARPQLRDGRWLVLIARAAATRASWLEMQSEWLALAQRAALFRA